MIKEVRSKLIDRWKEYEDLDLVPTEDIVRLFRNGDLIFRSDVKYTDD